MPPPESLDQEQILVAVATNLSPAEDIAQAAGMSILELARIVTRPDNLKQLQQVSQLHALQREMMLGELKREALARLGELTDEVAASSADEVRASEVMRKACVDILRVGDRGMNAERRHSGTGSPGGPGGSGGGRHREPLVPASEAEVLAALNNWGKEENEYEPRDSREPSGPPPPRRAGRRTSGSVEPAGWSKAKPQAASGGRGGVKELEVTDGVQGGMAFGKTSDHGTGVALEHGNSTTSNRTDEFGFNADLLCQQHPKRESITPVPPAPPVPPSDVLPLRPLRTHHRPMVGWDWEHGGCRPPPLCRQCNSKLIRRDIDSSIDATSDKNRQAVTVTHPGGFKPPTFAWNTNRRDLCKGTDEPAHSLTNGLLRNPGSPCPRGRA